MDVSAIQSGYSAVTRLQPTKTASNTIATEWQTITDSNTKTANDVYRAAKSSTSLLSSSVNSALLQQQETKQFGLQGIANKYDVMNLSGNERAALAQELRDNDFISGGVHLALVAPLSINEDFSVKTNYIDTARKAFTFAEQHGVSGDQLAIQKEQLDILEQLNALQA